MRRVSPQVNKYRPRRRGIWKRFVSTLAVITVFCTVYALVLPAITLADEPICGQQAHEHTEDCYRSEYLVANCAAANHVHSESCADALGNPACGFGERILHTHGQNCYSYGELICPLPELQEHLHEHLATDDEPCCDLEQVANHVHSPGCLDEDGQRICGLISGVPHVHDETCFTVIRLDQPELLCSLPEHIHVDSCYLEAADLPQNKKEFYCGMGQHTHTDECYDREGTLLCTMPEHSHDVSCKVPDYDPQANVESEEDWEAAFRDLNLTGHWPTDLMAVAQTQLGYRESKQNVILREDGTLKGYSRYGAWYGADYMDWSAAFVSFCIHYANIDGLPQDSSCESYRSKLEEEGLFRNPMEYLPKPGDLVLLDSTPEDEDLSANQMGILWELMLSDQGELTTLKVLVGDAADEVKFQTFDLLSPRILGYGETPDGQRQILLCQQDHEHLEDCYGYRLYYTDDTMSAQLMITGLEQLPQNVSLQLHRVTAASDPAQYTAMLDAMNRKMEESPYYMGQVDFYQTQLLHSGESYTLPHTATTRLEISFHAPVFTPEEMESAVKVETYQLIQQEQATTWSLRATNLDGDGQLYQVNEVREDEFQNADEGLTGLSFESDGLATFAVVLSNTTKTGQFWERLFSLSELSKDDTYLIVSSEGNYVLRGNSNNNYTAVTIHAQKGEESPDAAYDANPERNTRYYTITANGAAVNDSQLYWTITPGTDYTARNQGTSVYLNLRNSLMSNGSSNLKLEYKTAEQGFRFSYSNSTYLRNTGTGAFSYGNGNDGQSSNNSSYKFYYSRDMLIFKLSDVTSLSIPDDVVGSSTDITDTHTKVVQVYDASTLAAGDQIIIAALDYDYAMSTTQNTNNRGRASVTKSFGELIYGDDTQIITLQAGKVNNTFGFYVGGKYLAAASSRNNYLKSNTSLDNNGSWSIQIDAATGAATVKTNGSYTRNLLRYDTSGVFSCYSSTSSGKSVCLYKVITGLPNKPDYGEFITPTDGLTGDTALSKDGVSVKGQYYSDPATSDIETQFRQDSYEASKVIDGKVVTDKSVIYGKDDYGAFDHYDPNTFSVTLSALGQEYELPYVHRVKTPVDVVFVLDVSGSMTSNSTTQGENPNRVIDLCKAVNAAMAQIMEDHEANRVGISIYSSGAWEMLPLDRYTATNNEYLVTKTTSFKHSPTNYNFTINYLLGSSSLKNSANKSYANAGSTAIQGIGTYTQAGIAMGNEIFEAIEDDTTYTTTVGEGDLQRTYTVKRQPVFILVSDGEPTHSTSIYNDVLKGPHYGNGNSTPSTNGAGVHGYYTVLSANYYKRAVGIQYGVEPMFYSIGMGIHTTEDGPLVSTGKTGDNYKRAILNPTPEIIANLTSNKEKALTTDQLKSMLQSEFTSATVKVSADWPDDWYGVPHVYEPVLQPNPYADDYAYADGAYFGDLPESELKAIFKDIYESSITYRSYGFVLYRNSSVDVFDNIGQGMEIKGDPVLRYAGVNYQPTDIRVNGNVTQYVYQGIIVDPYIPGRKADLSDISVTVTKNADGTQTVEMYIIDEALPTYTPDLVGLEFYYEQLPVRLIYQVGLTEESEQAVLNLNQTGGELVFYTNQWENWDDISTSILLPSTANPFYYHIDGTEAPYKPHHSLKTEDTTNTVDYHVDCHREIEELDGEVLVKVIHKQGNNGKLVFKADTVSIPVEKVWGSGINAEVMNPVEINVYKITETVDLNGKLIRNAQPVSSLTLSNDNGWKATAQGLPAPEEGWYYAVAEAIPAGYTATYEGERISITTDGEYFFDAVRYDSSVTAITVTNQPAVRLPSTGGGGTQWYTLGGLLLMAAAVFLWYNIYLQRRREAHVSP